MPFEEKIAENAASQPNFGDFFGRRAPPPAARRHAWADGGHCGILEGEEPLVAAVQELVLEIVVMGRGEVVVMVFVVVRAGDGAASAVSVDRERDVPRPRPRAAPPPRGRRVRASRSVPPAFSWSARRARTLTAKYGRCSRAGAAKPGAGTEATSRRAGGPSGG